MSKVRWKAATGLVVLTLLAAPITYAGLLLPASTHYQGSVVDGDVLIHFAVYDTQVGNEFAKAGYSAPGEGRYTYVYKLFVGDLADSSYIKLFGISGIGSGAINSAGQIGWQGDAAEGVAPENASFDTSWTEGTWQFENGALITDKHSAYLVISSDKDWVKGQYVVERTADLPVPGGDGNEVPEPMTLGLMATGALGLLARRKARS